MKEIVVCVAAAMMVAACATEHPAPAQTKAPPPVVSAVTNTSTVDAQIAGTPSQLLAAANQVLVQSGFQIASANTSAGVLTTAPRSVRLTPADANCGASGGVNYLEDKRTSTTLAYDVTATDGHVHIVAKMDGTYLPGNNVQSVKLSCVSTGVLEQKLVQQIEAVRRSS
ncbi:MAG TPA: hypothetical protein VF265_06020 [Nevskiaceae bacterium]